ncbi:lysozyme inhibitor LprI family protein [Roseobacteraceae bacterium S113]
MSPIARLPSALGLSLSLGLITAASTGLQAQELNCANPVSQAEMTGCAARAYEAADVELNVHYKAARAVLREADQYLAPDEIPGADLLRDAQRAWIPYRDAACTAESLVARGGTLQNQLYFLCLERLTRQRTEDLRLIAEVQP